MNSSQRVQRNTKARARLRSAAMQLFAVKGTTDVSYQELAETAEVSRATVYNNIDSIDLFFQSIAAELESDMHRRVVATFADEADPAKRLATGMRLFVRRAHEEPSWGRFMLRFTFNERSVRVFSEGPPTQDLIEGLKQRRYSFDMEHLPEVGALITGTTLAAMHAVVEGRRTWRDAGTNSAALVLRALGVPNADISKIVHTELPGLSA